MSNEREEPKFHLDADSLLSKWGFGDGDALRDWWWDNFDEDVPFDEDDALQVLVETHLLPLIRDAGHKVEFCRISTIHNPVRIVRLDGVEVDWYDGNDRFSPSMSVAVSRVQIEAAAARTVTNGDDDA